MRAIDVPREVDFSMQRAGTVAWCRRGYVACSLVRATRSPRPLHSQELTCNTARFAPCSLFRTWRCEGPVAFACLLLRTTYRKTEVSTPAFCKAMSGMPICCATLIPTHCNLTFTPTSGVARRSCFGGLPPIFAFHITVVLQQPHELGVWFSCHAYQVRYRGLKFLFISRSFISIHTTQL